MDDPVTLHLSMDIGRGVCVGRAGQLGLYTTLLLPMLYGV